MAFEGEAGVGLERHIEQAPETVSCEFKDGVKVAGANVNIVKVRQMNAKVLEGFFTLKGGEFVDAGAASRSLKDVLQGVGVSQETIRRAAIAAFEAEMNVIIHAVAGSLHYIVNENEIEITVTDIGPGIENVELAMQEGYSTAPQWAREMGWGAGFGLPNIKNNTDRLKIDTVVREGTTLHMRININGKCGVSANED